MFNSRINNLLLVLATVLALSSCKKGDPSWDVNVVGPVAYSSMSIYDLLPDTMLQSNADSSVNLVYSDNVYTLELDSLWDIPDTSLREVYQIPLVASVGPGDTFITGAGNTQYELGDAELYEAVVREGQVVITLTSTLDQPTVFEYNLVNATLMGIPFQRVITIPASTGGVPGSVTSVADLSGYHLDLRGPAGDSFNFMQSTYSAWMDPMAPDSAHINGLADSVTLNYSFVNFTPQYARGFFGQKTVSVGPETVETGIFGVVQSGTIDIDQCSVDLELINKFGVDGRATANQLESFNSATSTSIPLTHSVIGSDINLSRAIDGGGYPIPMSYVETLTNLNSNIDLFLENLPDQLTYDIDFEINPLGNVSGGNDFFYYGNTFEANLNLDIPLCIIADQLTLVDTTEFTYPDDENGEVIDGKLYIMADNGFPFSASLNVLLLDQNKVQIGSITPTGTILAGMVNGMQEVTASTNTLIEVNVPAATVSALRNTHYLVLIPTFTTTSLIQHTKIYDHYLLDVKVTTDFNYLIQSQ